jgi:hypothetical protein
MNAAFDAVLDAGDEARRDLFIATGARLGTVAQNIEKDFWVCWTLDALFNGLPPGGPRLLFKGGTSLSKGYGLISRFSEDIDITVFREDLGQSASMGELEALSRKKREARLDAIRSACQTYVRGTLRDQLAMILAAAARRLPTDPGTIRVTINDEDPDGQSLLLWYPAVTVTTAYVRPAVKIEAGAKSALDPHTAVTVKPYVDDDLPGIDLSVAGVTTVDPTRTFWDNVIILHGLRRWFDRRGELRGGEQRVSRHYYDIYRLLEAEAGRQALLDVSLGADCVRHARMFFNRPDLDLESAVPGSFALMPHDSMIGALRRDFGLMSSMIFGRAPDFNAIMDSVGRLQRVLNDQAAA